MAVIRYTKHRPVSRPLVRTKIKRERMIKLFVLHRLAPVFLMGTGVFLLVSVVFPILTSEFQRTTTFQAGATDNTVGSEVILDSISPREYLLPTAIPTPIIVADTLDFTDLSNWFPDSVLPIVEPKEEKRYLISIPKVNIEDAEVVVGGKELDDHLIQYPGTSLPGDFGAPVIFGHSVLRQFYNPSKSNPRRYISIFSKIMTLAKGDEILVKEDGVLYRYQVLSKTEVQPTDLFILEQQRDSRLLKLVTCVPEGTYLRRGVVTAVLVESKR